MLYLKVIDEIEAILQQHTLLKSLTYYRFSLPTSSVRSKFICIPRARATAGVSHVNPCITDDVDDSCIGNFADQHMLNLSVLVGAAKHGSMDATEVLDVLQNCVVEVLKENRFIDDNIRSITPFTVFTDSFFEISKNHVGSIVNLDIKYQDSPTIPDEGQILYLLDPTVEEG